MKRVKTAEDMHQDMWGLYDLALHDHQHAPQVTRHVGKY